LSRAASARVRKEIKMGNNDLPSTDDDEFDDALPLPEENDDLDGIDNLSPGAKALMEKLQAPTHAAPSSQESEPACTKSITPPDPIRNSLKSCTNYTDLRSHSPLPPQHLRRVSSKPSPIMLRVREVQKEQSPSWTKMKRWKRNSYRIPERFLWDLENNYVSMRS